jgi:dipeptidyl aminopeptidase/acylaminoacyl peptidase
MRLCLALTALVVAVCASSIHAFPYVYFPDSQHPAFLGDLRILFESNLDARNTGDFRRVPYVASPDGSEVLPAAPGTTPPDTSLSPDGRSRAFVRDGDVFVGDAGGGEARNLTDDSMPQAPDEVRWSPDGTHLSFLTVTPNSRTGFVEVVRRDGAGRRRLRAGAAARWLSNDTVVVAHTEDVADYSAQLVAVDIATRQGRTLVGEHFPPGGFDVSPDGETIVFSSWVGWTYGDGSTLYVVGTAPGSEPRRLTPTACTIFPEDASGSLRGRCYGGTDGADRIVGTVFGDVVIAGSGADEITAGDGQNIIQAQWGDDVVRSGEGRDSVRAGDGDDVVRTGADRDVVRLGSGRDSVATGAGNDVIVANDGERDVLDCGTGGRDRAIVDAFDSVRRCDKRIVAPPATQER